MNTAILNLASKTLFYLFFILPLTAEILNLRTNPFGTDCLNNRTGHIYGCIIIIIIKKFLVISFFSISVHHSCTVRYQSILLLTLKMHLCCLICTYINLYCLEISVHREIYKQPDRASSQSINHPAFYVKLSHQKPRWVTVCVLRTLHSQGLNSRTKLTIHLLS